MQRLLNRIFSYFDIDRQIERDFRNYSSIVIFSLSSVTLNRKYQYRKIISSSATFMPIYVQFVLLF